MKLLILTQKVDKNDPVLGFFHRWLEAFAGHFDQIEVIALGKGEMSLPGTVRVHSLGKEEGLSKLTYLWRFYRYAWGFRREYDAVFVHMNQEYVLLGWMVWRLLGKPIYLWRNHAKGNFFTCLAVLFSKKVFYTSPQSFTAQFKKAVAMPVGIDTEFFKPDPAVLRKPDSLIFLGRISPVKKVHEFLRWFATLDSRMTATVAGEALPNDREYFEGAKRIANQRVQFIGAVSQDGARGLYRTHEAYVNKTPAGSFDKTIFEAAACGAQILVDNEDLKFLEGKSSSELRRYVEENHSLTLLVNRLINEIK